MEELTKYEPDMFIVYTGHNEFLEERTYGEIKRVNPVLKKLVGWASYSRIYSKTCMWLHGSPAQPCNSLRRKSIRSSKSLAWTPIIETKIGEQGFCTIFKIA